MAIQLQAYLSPHFRIHQSVPFRKPIYGMVMPRKAMPPLSKTIKVQIKSSIRDMVFEDHSRGIVCYKDDRGEIICEGLDEGPRLLPQYQPTPLPSFRDDGGERLEERWLRFVDGTSGANSSLLVKEKHSCNGYNTLY